MKHVFHLRGATLIACALLVSALCGCIAQDSSVNTFLEVVQTALLGVTAAGAVVIIREV